MTHETEHERMDDYLAGTLNAEERAVFERELERNDALRHALDAARMLNESAQALPKRIEPPRDLWPEIADRLDRPSRPIDFGRYRRRNQRLGLGRYGMAAAALLLLALSVPVFVRSTPVVENPAQPVVLADDPEYRRVEAQYLEARQELVRLLQERRGDMAPETLATVEENLGVIASAMEDIETAIAVDPSNRKLERMLHATHRSEIELLHRAVDLTGQRESWTDKIEGESNDA